MLGNLAHLVVVSFVSLGTLFSSSPKIISPLPEVQQKTAYIKQSTSPQNNQAITASQAPIVTVTPTDIPVQASTPAPSTSPKLTPSPVVTAVPTPTISVTPQPTVTTMPTAPPTAPVDIEALFTDHANHYSVDKELLKQIARCESGMNSSAQNGPYGGMYQFSESSWSSTRAAMGMDTNPSLRFDPAESIRTAAFKLSTGGRSAWPNC